MSTKQGNWITLKCLKNSHTIQKKISQHKMSAIDKTSALQMSWLLKYIHGNLSHQSSFFKKLNVNFQWNEIWFSFQVLRSLRTWAHSLNFSITNKNIKYVKRLSNFFTSLMSSASQITINHTFSIFGYVLNSTKSIAASYAYINR